MDVAQRGVFVYNRTFWSSKVNDVPVFLEHVDLLYCLNRLDIEFFERCL